MYENDTNIFEDYRTELIKLYCIIMSSGQTFSQDYLREKLEMALSGRPIICHTSLVPMVRRLKSKELFDWCEKCADGPFHCWCPPQEKKVEKECPFKNWKPIETAPLDGSFVLLGWKDWDGKSWDCSITPVVAAWDNNDKAWLAMLEHPTIVGNPSYWAPLP